MAKISWTCEAECWLQDIFNFISLDNADAATRVIGEIYERAQILIRFPKIGHRYEAIEDREVRILLYGHYWNGILNMAGLRNTISKGNTRENTIPIPASRQNLLSLDEELILSRNDDTNYQEIS